MLKLRYLPVVCVTAFVMLGIASNAVGFIEPTKPILVSAVYAQAVGDPLRNLSVKELERLEKEYANFTKHQISVYRSLAKELTQRANELEKELD